MEWAYAVAAIGILAISGGLARAGFVGTIPAAVALAASALIALLAAWTVAGRVVPWIMLPAIALFAVGTFVHWRYVLPQNRRRRSIAVGGPRLQARGHEAGSPQRAAWKRWRYVSAISTGSFAIIGFIVARTTFGLADGQAIIAALAAAAAITVLDQLTWRLQREQLQLQGWEW